MLNSKYINHIHESISLNKGKIFAKVLLKNLAKLPIYDIDFKNEVEKGIHNNIVTIVKVICEQHNSENNIKILLFEQVVDALVFELYFPEHMKERIIQLKLNFIKSRFHGKW
ncbi:hypothetical protein PN36_10630 [Candidatus Thiomargarita nelsonii]|uniref:Uncharacterized protein n=1 Tax=Candidatus Thiomargarita nelsonii TaxID=1003181 RepID=A0A4E0QUP2_9GAMM|nr:hypothetical protein PN36_10630 [Candidatus Thiomargarita nelsonii]